MSEASTLTELKVNWYQKYRKYIQRIQRKHKLKIEFLINHADNIIKHTLRFSMRHAVIKRHLRIKKHSISIKYDLPVARKVKEKRRRVSWLKYYKEHAKTKQSPVVTVEEISIHCEPSTSKTEEKGDTSCDEDVDKEDSTVNLSREDVTSKLKEQLNILKSGKRDVSLLGDVDKSKPPKASICTKDSSTAVKTSEDKAEKAQAETLTSARSLSDSNSTVENTLNDSDLSEKSTSYDRTKFLDSLISKLGSSAEKDETGASTSKPIFSKSSNKNGILTETVASSSGKEVISKDSDEKSKTPEVEPEKGLKSVSDTDSSCSSDFRGFTDKEVYEAKLQLLSSSTREIESSDISAFVSENLDNFFRENCLEDSSNFEIIKPPHVDDGLVVDPLRPPFMPEPAVQSSIKARTVAEKRQLLAKCGNNEWMVEIENTVFRELQKRQKSKNYVVTNMIKELQDAKIPFQRECWRATSWLCTEIGKYYFQTISVDGCELRLFGSRGNHEIKLLAHQSSRPFERHSNEICPPVCKEKGPIDNVRLFMPYNRDISVCKSPRIKAAPLSKKCLQMIPHTTNLNLGPLIKYRMPQIELEVFPRLNKPLNDHVKPYLKMLTVSGDITKEFAQYAASVVVNKSNTKKKRHPISFKFKIPYENDQKYLLVRKIYERREDHSQLEKELSFGKSVDDKDDVAVDCAKALNDMINSAAIGLCEESFAKRDPDIDYEKANNQTDFKSIDPDTVKPKIDRKSNAGKLRTELKRLNATFVDAQRTVLEGKTNCTEPQCKLGCICHSIAVPAIARRHCRKAACMFECTCEDKFRYLDASDEILTDNNVLLLREKVTAKLARVEKEFCSTVVLTDDQPLLVNDPHISRKRTKKVPKRFQDYINEDLKNTEVREEPKNEVEPINENMVKYKFDTTAQINVSKTYPIMKDSASDQFRHCLVKIRKLKGLESIEPWCMVHSVYKCFCQSKATKSQASTVEKANVSHHDHVNNSRKRKNSFDKQESIENNGLAINKNKEKEVPSVPPQKQMKAQKVEVPPQTQTSINRYIPENYCSRSRPIPREFYRKRNRLRLPVVQQRIDIEETTNVANRLLQIMKTSAENVKKARQFREMERDINLSHQNSNDKNNRFPTKRKSDSIGGHVVNVLPKRFANGQCSQNDDNSVPVESIVKPNSMHNENTSLLAGLPPNKVHKIHLSEVQRSPVERKQTKVAKPTARIEKNILEVTPTITEGSPDMLNIDGHRSPDKVPIISSVRSLNFSNLEHESSKANHNSKTGSNQQINHLHGFINIDSLVNKVQSKELLEMSVKKLNNLVTRAMHCFCDNQRQSSANLPVATKGIVFLHKWSDFMQAYNEEALHVWYVSTNNQKILVATKENLMPRVIGAISNSNIKAVPNESLPLLAKLVKTGFVYGKPNQLSVFMFGEQDYWRICGFTHSKTDYLTQGCVVKPTPQTHPALSFKINKLFKVIFCTEWTTLNSSSNGKKKHNISVIKAISKPDFGPKPASSRGNVEELPISEAESRKIYIPMTTDGVSYWLMFKIGNDFSQVFIPAWETLIDFVQIQYAVRLSSTSQKVVQIIRGKGRSGVYATPTSNDAIYIGPFDKKYAIEIILLQKYNGRILRREDYESLSKIKPKYRSVMFWLHLSGDKLIRRSNVPQRTVARAESKDTSDECIVIEDDEEFNNDLSGEVEESIEANNSSIPNLPGVSSSEELDLSKNTSDNELSKDKEVVKETKNTNDKKEDCSKHTNVIEPLETVCLKEDPTELKEKIEQTQEQEENLVDCKKHINKIVPAESVPNGVESTEAVISQDLVPEVQNKTVETKSVLKCVDEKRLETSVSDDLILPKLESESKRQSKKNIQENISKTLESNVKKPVASLSPERSLLRKSSCDNVKTLKEEGRKSESDKISNTDESGIPISSASSDKIEQKHQVEINDKTAISAKLSKNNLNLAASNKTPIVTNKVPSSANKTSSPANKTPRSDDKTLSSANKTVVSQEKSMANSKNDTSILSTAQTSDAIVLTDTLTESVAHKTYTKAKGNLNLSTSSQNSEIQQPSTTNNESSFKSSNLHNLEHQSKTNILPSRNLEIKKRNSTPSPLTKSSKLMEHVQNLSKKKESRLSTSVTSSNREGDKVKFETSTGGYIIVERLKNQQSQSNHQHTNVSKSTMNVLAQLPKNLPKDLIITPEEPINSRGQELHTWKKVKRLSNIPKTTLGDGLDMEKSPRHESTEPIVDLTENTNVPRKSLSETVAPNKHGYTINRVESKPTSQNNKPETSRLETSPKDSQIAPQPTGFLISPVLLLGKVPARRQTDGYIVHVPGSKGYIKFQDVKHFGRYMVKYLLRFIKGFAPENWYPTWNYVPINSGILNKYPLHDPRKLHSKMIITSARKDTPDSKRMISTQKVAATSTKVSTSITNAKLPVLQKPQGRRTIDSNLRPQSATLKRRNTICTTKPVVDPNVILIDDE